MAKRMIETSLTQEDVKIEGSLRPKCLADYIGQTKVKENLKIYRGGETAERCAGPCALLRSARTGENDTGRNHSSRNGSEHESDQRARD